MTGKFLLYEGNLVKEGQISCKGKISLSEMTIPLQDKIPLKEEIQVNVQLLLEPFCCRKLIQEIHTQRIKQTGSNSLIQEYSLLKQITFLL